MYNVPPYMYNVPPISYKICNTMELCTDIHIVCGRLVILISAMDTYYYVDILQ